MTDERTPTEAEKSIAMDAAKKIIAAWDTWDRQGREDAQQAQYDKAWDFHVQAKLSIVIEDALMDARGEGWTDGK